MAAAWVVSDPETRRPTSKRYRRTVGDRRNAAESAFLRRRVNEIGVAGVQGATVGQAVLDPAGNGYTLRQLKPGTKRVETLRSLLNTLGFFTRKVPAQLGTMPPVEASAPAWTPEPIRESDGQYRHTKAHVGRSSCD